MKCLVKRLCRDERYRSTWAIDLAPPHLRVVDARGAQEHCEGINATVKENLTITRRKNEVRWIRVQVRPGDPRDRMTEVTLCRVKC